MTLLKWATSAVLVAVLGVWASAQVGAPGPAPRRGEAPKPDPWEWYPKDTAMHPQEGEKGGIDISGPYAVVLDHFKPPFPKGWTWGAVTGVYAESPDRVYIYARGMLPELDLYNRTLDGVPVRNATMIRNNRDNPKEHILTVYDRNGNVVDDFKNIDALHQEEGAAAHRIKVSPYDPEKHLWLVDEGSPAPGGPRGQILKVTRQGKVVMRLGPDKVAYPQDLAFMPNGDMYVAFAYNESRIVKFSNDGEKLMEFGKLGSGPGETSTPHGITIDKAGRIIVGESRNHRIQVFDQNGQSLDIWPNIPFDGGALLLDQNNIVWVNDVVVHKIAGYDLNGKLIYSWGTMGMYPGELYGPAQITTDSEGNLYVVEHFGGRAQMFRPKKGANPKHLVGPIWQ